MKKFLQSCRRPVVKGLRALLNRLGFDLVRIKRKGAKFESPTPLLMKGYEERIQLAASCRDCDHIEKVESAGEISRDEQGRLVQLMFNGVKVLAGGYSGDWMAELIQQACGHHEPQEELAFHTLLPFLEDGGVMVELGSYWAFYSCWFKKEKPASKVVCVEPHRGHLALGIQNFQLNSLKEETFIHAFSGNPKNVQQLLSGDQKGVFSRRFILAEEILEIAGGKVEMLHLDIQGSELDVLKDWFEYLKEGRVKCVMVSTHHFSFSGSPLTHQHCLHLLEVAGGKVLAEHDVFESFSGDGFICAYFGNDWASIPPIEFSYCRSRNSLFREPSYDLEMVFS